MSLDCHIQHLWPWLQRKARRVAIQTHHASTGVASPPGLFRKPFVIRDPYKAVMGVSRQLNSWNVDVCKAVSLSKCMKQEPIAKVSLAKGKAHFCNEICFPRRLRHRGLNINNLESCQRNFTAGNMADPLGCATQKLHIMICCICAFSPPLFFFGRTFMSIIDPSGVSQVLDCVMVMAPSMSDMWYTKCYSNQRAVYMAHFAHRQASVPGAADVKFVPHYGRFTGTFPKGTKAPHRAKVILSPKRWRQPLPLP